MRATEDSLLAVGYGPTAGPEDITHLWLGIELRYGHAPRFDLGMIEMLFALCLAVAFAATWRRRLPPGFYVVGTALTYAPARFAMDFLRATDLAGADVRYLMLTPAQWACLALFGVGVVMAIRASKVWIQGERQPGV